MVFVFVLLSACRHCYRIGCRGDIVRGLMVWVYYLLLLLTAIVGLAFALLTLPGLWLILGAAAAYALLTHGVYLGVNTLIALLVLAAGAEIAELAIGGAGAKKAGGTAWGIAGGFAGAILGGLFLTALIPILVLGTVVGICLGTFLGASGAELAMGKPVSHSLRIGVGAMKGKFIGIVGKVAVGIVMVLLVAVSALPWPHRDPPLAAQSTPTTIPATRR